MPSPPDVPLGLARRVACPCVGSRGGNPNRHPRELRIFASVCNRSPETRELIGMKRGSVVEAISSSICLGVCPRGEAGAIAAVTLPKSGIQKHRPKRKNRMNDARTSYDVIIVGAGPAGMNAALVLGRSRRHVLVCGAGDHRNAASRALHGYLTRDGINPRELLRIGRQQLERYDTVKVQDIGVLDIKPDDKRFAITLADNTELHARKILLATGVLDKLPDIPEFRSFYGQSIFHCPYCDGWEVRDLPLSIYGRGTNGPGLAQELTGWSSDLTLVTDGPAQISPEERSKLDRRRIRIREQKIARLQGKDGLLEAIAFDDGSILESRAMFFNLGHSQHSDLASNLGVTIDPHGGEIISNRHQSTNVPGVYVAGDAAFHTHFAIISASEGAIAGLAINTALLREAAHEGSIE